MRKALANAVRKYFTACLNEKLPQFQEIKSKDIPPGTRLYGWEVTSDVSFYLFLVIFQTRDWFTLEAAWSLNRRFPASAPPSLPYNKPKNGDLRFRLHTLWDDPRTDFWWRLTPMRSLEEELDQYMNENPVNEAMRKVRPLIDDAIRHVVQYAMPYFQTIVAAHECKT